MLCRLWFFNATSLLEMLFVEYIEIGPSGLITNNYYHLIKYCRVSICEKIPVLHKRDVFCRYILDFAEILRHFSCYSSCLDINCKLKI